MTKFNEPISEYGIKENIRKSASEKGKTLEGVYFYDNDFRSYCFSVGVLNIASLLGRCETIKDVQYFKCTKSGKMTVTRITY